MVGRAQQVCVDALQPARANVCAPRGELVSSWWQTRTSSTSVLQILMVMAAVHLRGRRRVDVDNHKWQRCPVDPAVLWGPSLAVELTAGSASRRTR